jgi:hypothetical protein
MWWIFSLGVLSVHDTTTSRAMFVPGIIADFFIAWRWCGGVPELDSRLLFKG